MKAVSAAFFVQFFKPINTVMLLFLWLMEVFVFVNRKIGFKFKLAHTAFLLMFMFSDDAVNFATKISVGTTMSYSRWKDLVNMPITISSKNSVRSLMGV